MNWKGYAAYNFNGHIENSGLLKVTGIKIVISRKRAMDHIQELSSSS